MQELDAAGLSYSYRPDINREGIIRELGLGYEALVIRSKTPVDRELIASAPSLRLVARGGSGMDNINMAAADDAGITCVNAGAANADAVGEHTVGMLLSLMHNLSRADAEVRRKIWLREENRGTEIGGKTLGIIGFGNTGSAVARKLSGFGMRILAYDKYKSGFGHAGVVEARLEQIMEEAEILSLHVPLTSETRFMISSEFIHRFVMKFSLLNLSRGEVVHTESVLEALESGKIRGFAADVLECEKFAAFGPSEEAWFQRLIARPDVVLAPHIGGWTHESYQRISAVMAAEIKAFFQAHKT